MTKLTPPVPPDGTSMTINLADHGGEELATRLIFEAGYKQAIPEREELESAYADAISALHYIEQMYGRLYGVGWDRLYAAAERLRGGGK
jgi:hypothetical protein